MNKNEIDTYVGHSDKEIVDVLYWDFPKVFDKILEHLENQKDE